VKLFIDESLSPDFALRLNALGLYDAIHPLHAGRCGEPDHRVLARCLDEDRVIVTQNARDFRKLVGRETVHPGLILLPGLGKAATWTLLQAALSFLADRGDPSMVMVNQVLDAPAIDQIKLSPLPKP
jgi:predicted nuclease of predicted toxin-antitoxin system